MLKDTHYDQVLYAFDTAATHRYYQTLFDAPLWPLIVYDKRTRRYRPKQRAEDRVIEFDPAPCRDRFAFEALADA